MRKVDLDSQPFYHIYRRHIPWSSLREQTSESEGAAETRYFERILFPAKLSKSMEGSLSLLNACVLFQIANIDCVSTF